MPLGVPSLLLAFAATGILDPALVLTRASTRTFFDANGQLRTAPANAPGFTFNPSTGEPLGLQVEDAATNLVLYSEDLSNAAWTKTNMTIAANSVAAPDGNTTADTMTMTGAGYATQAITTTQGYSITFSAHVKALASNFAYLDVTDGTNTAGAWFNLSTGAAGTSVAGASTVTLTRATILSLPNGWYRVSVTVATGTSTSFTCRMGPAAADNTAPANANSAYAWGMQAEAPGTLASATSYIATTSASATRAADVAAMPTTSQWFNPVQGTLFVAAGIDDAVLGQIGYLASLWDGTASNSIALLKAASNAVQGSIAAVGVEQLASLTSGTMAVAGTTKRVALSYRSNVVMMAVDGAAFVQDRDATIPTVTSLQIGRLLAGGNSIRGAVRSVAYWPFAASSADLQSLTA